MPHFDDQGREEWVCQLGAHVCTGESTWVEGVGNVCEEHAPKPKTVLNGWETELDKRVIAALEKRFGEAVVFFHAIREPGTGDRYWHVRIHGIDGVVFVRQNAVGDFYVYGPSKGEVITE